MSSEEYDSEETEPEPETKASSKAASKTAKPASFVSDGKLYYDCGSCSEPVSLNNKDAIMCKKCGHRILYKQRLDKRVEYLAR